MPERDIPTERITSYDKIERREADTPKKIGSQQPLYKGTIAVEVSNPDGSHHFEKVKRDEKSLYANFLRTDWPLKEHNVDMLLIALSHVGRYNEAGEPMDLRGVAAVDKEGECMQGLDPTDAVLVGEETPFEEYGKSVPEAQYAFILKKLHRVIARPPIAPSRQNPEDAMYQEIRRKWARFTPLIEKLRNEVNQEEIALKDEYEKKAAELGKDFQAGYELARDFKLGGDKTRELQAEYEEMREDMYGVAAYKLKGLIEDITPAYRTIK